MVRFILKLLMGILSIRSIYNNEREDCLCSPPMKGEVREMYLMIFLCDSRKAY